jgi:hypothetical protein
MFGDSHNPPQQKSSGPFYYEANHYPHRPGSRSPQRSTTYPSTYAQMRHQDEHAGGSSWPSPGCGPSDSTHSINPELLQLVQRLAPSEAAIFFKSPTPPPSLPVSPRRGVDYTQLSLRPHPTSSLVPLRPSPPGSPSKQFHPHPHAPPPLSNRHFPQSSSDRTGGCGPPPQPARAAQLQEHCHSRGAAAEGALQGRPPSALIGQEWPPATAAFNGSGSRGGSAKGGSIPVSSTKVCVGTYVDWFINKGVCACVRRLVHQRRCVRACIDWFINEGVCACVRA